jgi:hypothetical protein
MTVKTVGASGQISLGKEYAGRTVIVENPEEGVWIIRTAQVIPESERWLHEEPAKSKLEAGLSWAAETPAAATDLDAFEAEVLGKQEQAKE